jgi:hypothetical protein
MFLPSVALYCCFQVYAEHTNRHNRQQPQLDNLSYWALWRQLERAPDHLRRRVRAGLDYASESYGRWPYFWSHVGECRCKVRDLICFLSFLSEVARLHVEKQVLVALLVIVACLALFVGVKHFSVQQSSAVSADDLGGGSPIPQWEVLPTEYAYTIQGEGGQYWALDDSGKKLWITNDKTELFNTAIAQLTSGGAIFSSEVEVPAGLSYGNTIIIVESYQGQLRVYSNQGKGFLLTKLVADPSTAGWDSTQAGYWWLNTAEGKIKFWDGSTIQALPSVGGGSSSYKLSPAYTVYKDGSTTYAMDSDGNIDFSSASSYATWQYAVTNAPSGSKIVGMPAVYALGSTGLTIPYDKPLWIDGSGTFGDGGSVGCVFTYYGTDWAIKTSGYAGYPAQEAGRLVLSNFQVECIGSQKGGVDVFGVSIGSVEDLRITQSSGSKVGIGLSIRSPSGAFFRVVNSPVESFNVGIFIGQDTTTVEHCMVNYCKVAFMNTAYNETIDGTAYTFNCGHHTLYESCEAYMCTVSAFRVKGRATTLLNPIYSDGGSLTDDCIRLEHGDAFTVIINPRFAGWGAASVKKIDLEGGYMQLIARSGGGDDFDCTGYLSDNCGSTISVSNGTWIAHGLITTPLSVDLTPRTQVTLWRLDANATHFQVGVSSGTVTVDWRVSINY